MPALDELRTAPTTSSQRNLALDFFRGLALIIILINHIPWNRLYWATPSRFGFSDATDIFVFISGYVSALAYSRYYRDYSWIAATRRIALRCLQIYGAHILMFILVVLICLSGNQLGLGPDYISNLNLLSASTHPAEALLGFLTLRYVPNYFDMLPMYLVILAILPLVFAATQWRRYLALLLPIGIYVAALALDIELLADAQSGRVWYFNPFCWQLLFFTGFAFAKGIIPVPGANRLLVTACLAILIPAAVIEFGATFFEHARLNDLRQALAPYTDKSHLGLLRLAHFLALAYIMYLTVTRWGRFLAGHMARAVITLGQNSLTAFVSSMSLSHVCGIAMDYWGRSVPMATLINCAGIITLLGIGQLAALHRNRKNRMTAADASATLS